MDDWQDIMPLLSSNFSGCWPKRCIAETDQPSMVPMQSNFDTCQNEIYRTLPAAVIVKPYAVSIMNAMLASYAAGIIDREALDHLIVNQIHRGAMLASEQSVEVRLTGERQGYCVGFTMHDHEGQIGDVWWTLEVNIIHQRIALRGFGTGLILTWLGKRGYFVCSFPD
jgi:hypothetical protein